MDEPKRGRPTNAQRDQKTLETALRSFGRMMDASRDDRMLSLADRRFARVTGAQWEGPWQDQFAKKPKLEINKVAGAVTRLEADHRANRCTVDFLPRDGSPKDNMADVCDGLYRADEQDSGADEAYDNAFSEMITGGMGAWRLRHDYEDDEGESEHQRIYIEPIPDADISVFFDTDAKKQDKSDATECFVRFTMDRAAYREVYGDDPVSWPGTIFPFVNWFDWYTPDVVYIAERYKVERKKVKFFEFKGPTGDELMHTEAELDAYVGPNGIPLEDDEEAVDDEGDGVKLTLRQYLEATGYVQHGEPKTRKIKKVRKWVMSGGKVLEDCGYIAGKNIPIVVVYGIRNFVQNKERWQGLVRLAADPQRVHNMQVSRLAEISAYSPVEVPIFHPEEIDAYAVDWATNNIDPKPYLRRDPIQTSGGEQIVNNPVQYTKAPNIPPALVGLLQVTQVDLKDILGDQQQQEKVQPNTSGKAVEMIQQAVDRATAIYLDNFKKGMKRCGEIWLSMARDIYVERGRKMKTIAGDGKARSTITLGEPTIGEDGAFMRDGEYSLASASFDVVVDVGPSSVTRKAATVRALTQMLAFIPPDDKETQQALVYTTLANMEGEGLGPINDWARRKAVKAGILEPTEQEEAEMAKEAEAAAMQPPDPQVQLVQAAAEKEKALQQKAQAQTLQAMADVERTQAEVKHTEAQTLETLSKVGRDAASPKLVFVDPAQRGKAVILAPKKPPL